MRKGNVMKRYKEKYEDLICSLKGLQLGLKMLECSGNECISIKTIYNGIENAIKESEEE
jgi:hypothetical protein